jgi:hypothetical protein
MIQVDFINKYLGGANRQTDATWSALYNTMSNGCIQTVQDPKAPKEGALAYLINNRHLSSITCVGGCS